MKIDKKELKRWGFFERDGNVWFNSHLCVEMRVIHHFLRDNRLDEYDFVTAVYERGKINGISEIQANMRRHLGISQ